MEPKIGKSCYISKTSVIIGNVKIKDNCGIFPHAVIRGDKNLIEIDKGSNVQDCAVLHTDSKHTVKIGKKVSIGHGAIVHGAHIEDNVIVGMNATLMNGCEIGKGSIIGACGLVTENKKIPPNSLVLGIPGKIIKQDEKFEEMSIKNAETYKNLAKEHIKGEHIFYKEK